MKNNIGYCVSKSKFALAAADLNDSLTQMFVGALREGITAGFEEALRLTVHDSSNTAVHWKVGVKGVSNPSSRANGTFSQLRGTHRSDPKHSLVGYKYDQRSVNDEGTANEVNKSILSKEITEVIAKYAAGNKPEIQFYYFNPNTTRGYSQNANVEEAGEAGVLRAIAHFDREVKLGNVRRYRLK